MDETCTSFLALFFRTNTRTSGTETPLEDSEPEQKYKQKQIKKCNLLKGLNDWTQAVIRRSIGEKETKNVGNL